MILHQYVGKAGREIYLCSNIVDVSAPTLIIVPGLGWYHAGPNRMFADLASRCSSVGLNTVTYDYPGEGESRGSYQDVTWDALVESARVVGDHVNTVFTNKRYYMGFGIGNHLLVDMSDRLGADGLIFYLPSLSGFNGIETVFDPEETVSAEGNGYYEVQMDAQHCMFWRSIVGYFHDCAYNPINYSLIRELFAHERVARSPLTLGIDKLVITDAEQKDSPNTSIRAVPEFKNHIHPDDWVERNLWPLVLERVNAEIVDWLSGRTQSHVKRSHEAPDAHCVAEIETKEATRRTICSFRSGDDILHGVLHSPAGSAKSPCIIFAPGIGGDKVDNYACGPRLGDFAAQHGFHLFRYDNSCSGAAARNLHDITWTRIINDFGEAIEALKRRDAKIDMHRLIIVSWSAGAKLASYAAVHHHDAILACCLWNPVLIDSDALVSPDVQQGTAESLDLAKFRKFVRHPSGKRVTELGGKFLGIDYYADERKYDFVELYSKMSQPTKIIWSSGELGYRNYKYLSQRQLGKNREVSVIEADSHFFTYEKLNSVFAETVHWIESIVRRPAGDHQPQKE